jgi:hypothetical protein
MAGLTGTPSPAAAAATLSLARPAGTTRLGKPATGWPARAWQPKLALTLSVHIDQLLQGSLVRLRVVAQHQAHRSGGQVLGLAAAAAAADAVNAEVLDARSGIQQLHRLLQLLVRCILHVPAAQGRRRCQPH